MTDEERVRRLLFDARKTAIAGGSMHALWDIIADAEALLAGRQTLITGDRKTVAAKIASMLKQGVSGS